MLVGGKPRCGKRRRADYILYLRRNFPIAIVEAKKIGLPAENGVQQAREYAEMPGLRFAYATAICAANAALLPSTLERLFV